MKSKIVPLPGFPIGSCPVEVILGVWKFSKDPFHFNESYSLPGHMIQLVLEGSYQLTTNGRTYHVKAGDLIYYYNSELVKWEGEKEPVSFYTIGFYARAMKPPSLQERVVCATGEIEEEFGHIYKISKERASDTRCYRLYASLMKILSQMKSLREREDSVLDADDHLWLQVEEEIMEKKMYRPTLKNLTELTSRSIASVKRSCRKVNGTSPLKRIKELRMEEAMGLLLCSDKSISEISEMLCYPRVHEFSREFSNYFGASPSLAVQTFYPEYQRGIQKARPEK